MRGVKDKLPGGDHSTNRSPAVKLNNQGSGYLNKNSSNSNFTKTIYQMPSINSIHGSNIKKGKELK